MPFRPRQSSLAFTALSEEGVGLSGVQPAGMISNGIGNLGNLLYSRRFTVTN
ncbi:hypothetical protein NLX86_28565 [Streptomyces sp. A3M-1-3]|uniref:hypothetical protein n=1 Tax=Streptomyces sp. A3M-1-3 TaxID=2962044 RepID=UPI0020B6C0DE|nr:hypothetical protein [Streptomyces sp. A3M-1-3]MCP3821903.1 hypothetical protein [Streptomyces sp. A3M-1-3]